MKNKFVVFGYMLALLSLFACDEEGARVNIKSEVASNDLQPLASGNYVLVREEADDMFEAFEWSAADFGFVSSQTYTLQMSKAGTDFANPVTIITTSDLAAAVKVSEINKFLLDLGLTPDEAASVDVRVMTTISDHVEPVYSTVQTFTITPYATSFPPIYLMGDATGGWDLAKAVAARNIAPSKYETVAEFTNGGKFRFFATASWDATQYRWSTFSGGSVGAELVEAGDSDGNFYFDGASGWYKMTIDLKNKTIVLTATEEPRLMMIGSAIQGWDLGKAVELTRVGDGLFEGTTSFTGGEIFRFFTKADWSAGTVNYTYFEGGSVDPLLENGGGGDSNFKFIGTTGTYTIKVDLYNLTVEME